MTASKVVKRGGKTADAQVTTSSADKSHSSASLTCSGVASRENRCFGELCNDLHTCKSRLCAAYQASSTRLFTDRVVLDILLPGETALPVVCLCRPSFWISLHMLATADYRLSWFQAKNINFLTLCKRDCQVSSFLVLTSSES